MPCMPSLPGSTSCLLVPFLLDKVALDSRFMQADGLHPNALGQPRVFDNVWPQLQPLLRR